MKLMASDGIMLLCGCDPPEGAIEFALKLVSTPQDCAPADACMQNPMARTGHRKRVKF